MTLNTIVFGCRELNPSLPLALISNPQIVSRLSHSTSGTGVYRAHPSSVPQLHLAQTHLKHQPPQEDQKTNLRLFGCRELNPVLPLQTHRCSNESGHPAAKEECSSLHNAAAGSQTSELSSYILQDERCRRLMTPAPGDVGGREKKSVANFLNHSDGGNQTQSSRFTVSSIPMQLPISGRNMPNTGSGPLTKWEYPAPSERRSQYSSLLDPGWSVGTIQYACILFPSNEKRRGANVNFNGLCVMHHLTEGLTRAGNLEAKRTARS
ncbi:hypothetical protein K438DRAFT_1766800 [Mycena galopus ATCC 62051]|nr:hypothetical protein K438DRAFT_1766800 [Mycena galopus ATCC 62051]